MLPLGPIGLQTLDVICHGHYRPFKVYHKLPVVAESDWNRYLIRLR
jgi:hypothetical protein